MLKTVYLQDDNTLLIEGGASIVVTNISVSYVGGIAIGTVGVDVYERDGTTRILQLLCEGLLASDFSTVTKNQTKQMTIPFLADKGVFLNFFSVGLATLTVSYYNVGA